MRHIIADHGFSVTKQLHLKWALGGCRIQNETKIIQNKHFEDVCN